MATRNAPSNSVVMGTPAAAAAFFQCATIAPKAAAAAAGKKVVKKPVATTAVVATVAKNFFGGATAVSTMAAATETAAPYDELTAPMKSTDPLVQAFYDSLKPAEIIAHRLAVTKLGTSYDVTRTRGFVAWSKARGT
jgi:hypothetical protein